MKDTLTSKLPSYREWMARDLYNPVVREILKEEGYI